MKNELTPRARAFTVATVFGMAALGWLAALGFAVHHWQTVSHYPLILWLVTIPLPAIAFAVEKRQPLQTTILAYIAMGAFFSVLAAVVP
jgi:hypothetical protein